MSQKFSIDLEGKTFTVELGKLAGQTNGAAVVTLGSTTVLVTCVMGKRPRTGIDYLPLTVDYEEKLYAAGKIKGSRFIKREGRPTDEAILIGRLIDRTLRPRFNQKIRQDIQIVVTVLSFDKKNDPDVLAILGASIALSVSDIPWNGPIAASRIAYADKQWAINPDYETRSQSSLDFIVSGTDDRVNMMEGGAYEVEEAITLNGIELAHRQIKKLIDFQKDIVKAINPKKTEIEVHEPNAELVEKIEKFLDEKLEKAIYIEDKTKRLHALGELKEDLSKNLRETEPAEKIAEVLGTADWLFEEAIDRLVHKNILTAEKRPDGRKLDEVRPLNCEVDFLPQTHGSAIFERGTTQTLSIVTLGPPSDEQIIDDMEIVTKKRFFHHYNFPPYSVGEIGSFRGPGRREIGHGALAERALEKILPDKDKFPYTIRVVSEILSSNGSSSMASVCASSMALMQAGVPVKTAVAGIAMGLMSGEGGKYKVLTDIQGPEDHHGDMDFKVAGTKNGVCAVQMDVKIEGVTLEMLKDAFSQAKKARLEILDAMAGAIKESNKELSPFAPRIIVYRINPDKIRDVIGPGGKVINEIISQTGAEIDIEDDGSIFITAANKESAEKALDIIKEITKEILVGEIYRGKIVKIMDFGAFVELTPKQDGLLHISELAPYRVKRVEDMFRVGDTLMVKVKNIDQMGRINLILAK